MESLKLNNLKKLENAQTSYIEVLKKWIKYKNNKLTHLEKLFVIVLLYEKLNKIILKDYVKRRNLYESLTFH
jgi:hypothetical protein